MAEFDNQHYSNKGSHFKRSRFLKDTRLLGKALNRSPEMFSGFDPQMARHIRREAGNSEISCFNRLSLTED